MTGTSRGAAGRTRPDAGVVDDEAGGIPGNVATTTTMAAWRLRARSTLGCPTSSRRASSDRAGPPPRRGRALGGRPAHRGVPLVDPGANPRGGGLHPLLDPGAAPGRAGQVLRDVRRRPRPAHRGPR